MPGQFRSNRSAIQKRIDDELTKRVIQSIEIIAGATKKKLKIGQPIVRIKGLRFGLDPSIPGQPPHALIGTLRQSIKTQVIRTTTSITGFVGTALKYGRFLEFGTRGGTIIRPKSAKALVFMAKGTGPRTVQRRRHPGPHGTCETARRVPA